jgi:hypothetical protein
VKRSAVLAVASGPEPVEVDEVGAALLLRSRTDLGAALAAMTGALAVEPGRVTVVTAPSVTARLDFLDVLAGVVDERLDGTSGLRLVTIGSNRTLSGIESDLRALAERTGREVVGPLGPVAVASDGTVAVAAQRGARGGWMVCPPAGPIRYESAWFPLPAWGTRLPAKIASRTSLGMATVHPVPAGLWLLPDGLRAGRAGVAASVPPDPSALTVFIGGCGQPPLVLADVIESLDALPTPERARIVLLPNAMAPGHGVARLRDWCGPSRPVAAAVPIWSPNGAWALAFIDASGALSWRPPIERRVFRPTIGRDGPRSDDSTRDELIVLNRQLASRQVPFGSRTPAGWSFLTGTAPIGVAPAAAGFVVEVTVASTGFLMEGRPIEPEALADLIETCGRPPRVPVVVVGHAAAPPADLDPNPVFAALADALDTTVISADVSANSDVSMSATGLLYTSGVFRTWRPMPAPAELGQPRKPRVLGDTLPPSAPQPPPSSTLPPSAPPPPQRPSSPDSVGRHAAIDRPPVAARTIRRRGTPPGSTITPLWITAADCDAEDGAHLRQVLNGRYDAYARAVVHALAENDELPHADLPTATVAGLVAVHAYCATERESVNRVLRGLDDPNRGASAAVVARCASYGLRRMPVVFGPVFAPCATDVPLEVYLGGGELIEPGFVDVDLSATDNPDAGIDYVIWSVSARRVDPAAHGEQATALFAPGSRFAVLGVDSGSRRPRVLLLDLAAQRHVTSASTERLLSLLIDAANTGVRRTREPLPALGFPIGLDDSGCPFLAAPSPSDLDPAGPS